MRLLKGLIILTVVVAALVVGIGLLLPDRAHVERSITVRAKPATVYVALDGFKRFTQWAPWTRLDPDTQYRHDGPPWGVGAKMTWSSDQPSVGHGSQEIVEAVPYARIRSRLVFSGFDSENYSTLTIRADGEGSVVSWAYDATFHGNLLGRFFALKLDDWVGKDYEQGLANLRAMVEPLADLGDDPLARIEFAEPTAGGAYALRIRPEEGARAESAAAALAAFATVAGLDRDGEPIRATPTGVLQFVH
ncbi:SRPBCC family protein [Solimonas soli]|uniref:SRPBCC family protein n=1 Tax=Solimonas soli TaxID=413479 RepID=UPI0004B5FEEF|nr:SRPBCC family protein [Solimonas soli]